MSRACFVKDPSPRLGEAAILDSYWQEATKGAPLSLLYLGGGLGACNHEAELQLLASYPTAWRSSTTTNWICLYIL